MFAEALLHRASERLFRHLEVAPKVLHDVREVLPHGRVVYVLRHASSLDFLALDHVTRHHGFPEIGFANELPNALRPAAFRWKRRASDREELIAALRGGKSAMLFLQQPPERVGGVRRKNEGTELLDAVLDLQRREPERAITFVPLLFVWTRRAERRGFSLVDSLFGPADFPGELRQLGQVLGNYQRGELRGSELLEARDFLTEQGPEPGDVLVKRLGYALLRKLDRERRTIVGPAHKPLDRMREEVLRSPKLQAVLRELAGPDSAQLRALEDNARAMLGELMTVPDPQAAKSLEALATTLLDRVYSGIDVDDEGIERIREAARTGTVVLLPSHKSHIDYIVLSYVMRRNSLQLPVIAAGDNLAFFPLGPLLRRGGAFFIRRTFRGDRLYTAVVDAYIRRLLREGWMLEFFLEGGRSRTGKLLPPMLGLLSMVVTAALPLERRKVSFFPVSIGYERLMEETSFARELSGGTKTREDASQLLSATRVLADRWGRVNIQVGRELELGALRHEWGIDARPSPAKRRELVKRLAHLVMREINHVTSVTPGALIALVMLGHGRRGMAYRELQDQCLRVAEFLKGGGARLAPSLLPKGASTLREQGLVEALRLYVRSGLLEQHVPGELHDDPKKQARLYTGTDVIFTVPDGKRLRLDFAKNHLVQFVVDRGLVALALTSCRKGPPPTEASVRELVRNLSRLFKFEFMFRADASFEHIFDETLAGMQADGELVRDGDLLAAGPGHLGLDGAGWISFHAAALRNFVEGYLVAARGLEFLLKGPLTKKDLVARSLKVGQRMALQGDIERTEAVERPLLENAFEAFLDQGYLARSGEGYALTPSFASEAGVKAAEARISAFLPRE
jgi:glycerol-3-phosphate O-acyltransferase